MNSLIQLIVISTLEIDLAAPVMIGGPLYPAVIGSTGLSSAGWTSISEFRADLLRVYYAVSACHGRHSRHADLSPFGSHASIPGRLLSRAVWGSQMIRPSTSRHRLRYSPV